MSDSFAKADGGTGWDDDTDKGAAKVSEELVKDWPEEAKRKLERNKAKGKIGRRDDRLLHEHRIPMLQSFSFASVVSIFCDLFLFLFFEACNTQHKHTDKQTNRHANY